MRVLTSIAVSKEDVKKFLGDVIKNVNKDMPLYKHIREFSIRDTAFIKTTTQKIKRSIRACEYCCAGFVCPTGTTYISNPCTSQAERYISVGA